MTPVFNPYQGQGSDDGLTRTSVPHPRYGFVIGQSYESTCGMYRREGMYYRPHMHTYTYLGHNGTEALWREDTEVIPHG